MLRMGLGLAGALCMPQVALAARTPARSLTLYSIHTGEIASAEYLVGGRYQQDALDAFAHLLRDHRTGDVHPIDPAVLDILFEVAGMVESREAYHVVSGYRSRQTNEWKWRHGRGVARDSFHLYGRAVDVYLPRRELRDLRRAALTLEAGGVGYYPRSGFVHVDTGPVRMW
jgi:uncharacterized protein YcbK (DUF882 family)